MGKNFSCNNVEGKRKKSDFYETPYSMTRRFIENETAFLKHLPTLEPACGDGAIVKVLEECGFTSVTSYDIEKDFLKETKQVEQVVTNPPFSIAQEFILKAKEVASERFAFLLPLSYLHGKKRYDEIFTDTVYPLRSVSVFTRYPLLGEPLRKDGKYRTGMMVYAWFHWEKTHSGPPTIKWIDNNSDVIGKKDI